MPKTSQRIGIVTVLLFRKYCKKTTIFFTSPGYGGTSVGPGDGFRNRGVSSGRGKGTWNRDHGRVDQKKNWNGRVWGGDKTKQWMRHFGTSFIASPTSSPPTKRSPRAPQVQHPSSCVPLEATMTPRFVPSMWMEASRSSVGWWGAYWAWQTP
jgi:hypothetical protein